MHGVQARADVYLLACQRSAEPKICRASTVILKPDGRVGDRYRDGNVVTSESYNG